ncbi:sugar ABC transporter substrate-binding protein [Mycoplasmopsis cricetuli]|uniref:sugar ABC transporter substrate-binding protein n=1 Tax=Mycoplasmopsis cricetuli TaxID=171283 RepID=UPI000471460B|nr:substrate-binding domain-containing protein [Mycoplasmopsis cricetuli]
MFSKIYYKTKKISKSGIALFSAIGCFTAIGAVIAINNRSSSKENITLILSTRSNPFFIEIENAVKNKLKDSNYNLIVLDSENDDSKQSQNISNAISLDSKAILINAVNSSTAWEGGIKNVYTKQIPVIAIDRSIITSQENGITQTIASNNIAGAKDIAKWFKSEYPNAFNFNVFHLGGVAGAQAALDRAKGFKQGFEKDYLTSEIADFNREKALEKTNIVLQSRGNEFKIIFADNDEMALGAIEAIKKQNYQAISTKPFDVTNGKYYVLGFDGTKDALNLVANGTLTATVIQQPKLMGELAVEAILDILKGKQVEKTKDAATLVVSKTNVNNYLSK